MSGRPLLDELGRAGRVAVQGDSFTFVTPGDDPPPGYRLLATVEEFAGWRWQKAREQAERAREIGERLAAEDRAYAARRRELGLPPQPPVHPELTPELVDEHEAYLAAGGIGS